MRLGPGVYEAVSRIFPGISRSAIERAPQGVSTVVYRIRRNGEVFYLRILPEQDASFAPEVAVHALLRERNVRVPEIVHFEQCNEFLQRSVMVMTAIPGAPLSQRPDDRAIGHILAAAGSDLAITNSIPVAGFGWIRRDLPNIDALEGEQATFRGFALGQLDEHLALLKSHGISQQVIVGVRSIVSAHHGWFDGHTQAWLAHGDLDLTHIYHSDGHYTGIIDFGEIRGANRLYDLGHFRMHDGETRAAETLPYLLAGYRDAARIPLDFERHILITSLFIATRTLAHQLAQRGDTRNPWALTALNRDIEALSAKTAF